MRTNILLRSCSASSLCCFSLIVSLLIISANILGLNLNTICASHPYVWLQEIGAGRFRPPTAFSLQSSIYLNHFVLSQVLPPVLLHRIPPLTTECCNVWRQNRNFAGLLVVPISNSKEKTDCYQWKKTKTRSSARRLS